MAWLAVVRLPQAAAGGSGGGGGGDGGEVLSWCWWCFAGFERKGVASLILHKYYHFSFVMTRTLVLSICAMYVHVQCKRQ